MDIEGAHLLEYTLRLLHLPSLIGHDST